ncbi:hypothetical protein D3C71_909190 [compost metagenome]
MILKMMLKYGTSFQMMIFNGSRVNDLTGDSPVLQSCSSNRGFLQVLSTDRSLFNVLRSNSSFLNSTAVNAVLCQMSLMDGLKCNMIGSNAFTAHRRSCYSTRSNLVSGHAGVSQLILRDASRLDMPLSNRFLGEMRLEHRFCSYFTANYGTFMDMTLMNGIIGNMALPKGA